MPSEAENIDLHPVADEASVLEQVPVIDIADLRADSGSAAARGAIDEIASACGSWGFFQVINHGIDATRIETVWQQTHALFALPLEQKLEILRSKANPWGFYNHELTKNQRDKKEVFDFTRDGVDPIYGQTNRWPRQLPQFQATMAAWLDDCTELSLKLLEAFCLGLDLPADFMHRHFVDRHTGFVRLNYYPVEDPLAQSGAQQAGIADLGIHHHTDAGALTVLLQDENSGLQVYRDGYWHTVPNVDGALVINTGDMMQVWSNDIYQAAMHRVLAMEQAERYSIPFFFNPAADCIVEPLPSVISDSSPCRYREIDWGEYRGLRTDGDYADYGTEVQISQYRI